MGVRIDSVVAGVQQARTTNTIDPAKSAGNAEDFAPSGEGQFKQALEKASRPKKADRQDKPEQTEKSQKPQKAQAKKAAKGTGASKDQSDVDASDATTDDDKAEQQQGGLPAVPVAIDEATESVAPEQQHETDADGAAADSADAITAEVAMSANIAAPVQAAAAPQVAAAVEGTTDQGGDQVAGIAKPVGDVTTKPVDHDAGGQEAEGLTDDALATDHPVETVAKKSSKDETPNDDQHQRSTDIVADQKPDGETKSASKSASPFAEASQTAVAQAKSQPASSHADQSAPQQQPDPTVPTLNLDPAAAKTPAQHTAPVAAPQPPAPAPEIRFADNNHPQIVTAVRSELLPNGGSMLLRLDPPDLGPMRLEVTMQDGAMTASFVTASDKAASLLSHSLGSLKQSLEAAGVSVDKLQVKQGSHEQFSSDSSADNRNGHSGANDQPSARHEQQRREMLNRMWRKVSGAADPLDLVA